MREPRNIWLDWGCLGFYPRAGPEDLGKNVEKEISKNDQCQIENESTRGYRII